MAMPFSFSVCFGGNSSHDVYEKACVGEGRYVACQHTSARALQYLTARSQSESDGDYPTQPTDFMRTWLQIAFPTFAVTGEFMSFERFASYRVVPRLLHAPFHGALPQNNYRARPANILGLSDQNTHTHNARAACLQSLFPNMRFQKVSIGCTNGKKNRFSMYPQNVMGRSGHCWSLTQNGRSSSRLAPF